MQYLTIDSLTRLRLTATEKSDKKKGEMHFNKNYMGLLLHACFNYHLLYCCSVIGTFGHCQCA